MSTTKLTASHCRDWRQQGAEAFHMLLRSGVHLLGSGNEIDVGSSVIELPVVGMTKSSWTRSEDCIESITSLSCQESLCSHNHPAGSVSNDNSAFGIWLRERPDNTSLFGKPGIIDNINFFKPDEYGRPLRRITYTPDDANLRQNLSVFAKS